MRDRDPEQLNKKDDLVDVKELVRDAEPGPFTLDDILAEYGVKREPEPEAVPRRIESRSQPQRTEKDNVVLFPGARSAPVPEPPQEAEEENVREPEEDTEPDTPSAFRQKTRLSQHISFLKDFFRSYKDFADRHIDTIELMLERLYRSFGLNDHTDFSTLTPTDYPILSDLYDVIEDAYQHYDREENPLYPKELLREILLGLHSMCRGAESKFFNGPTKITSFRFLVFGVKGLLQANSSVKNAMLFNVLSFFSDKLLTEGNTVATLDELYIWLSNLTAVEYIRNSLKRVRKKESALILASQNLEDFDQPGIRELTRPLFAIPTHQFLFNAGSVDKRFYMDNLQLEPSEFELIRYPQRGVCLYKCGNERYLLEVHAPPYKEKLFGTAGGR